MIAAPAGEYGAGKLPACGPCDGNSSSVQMVPLTPLSFNMLGREDPKYTQGMAGLVDVDSPPTAFLAPQLLYAQTQFQGACVVPSVYYSPYASLSPPLSPLPVTQTEREAAYQWSMVNEMCYVGQQQPPPEAPRTLAQLPAELLWLMCSFAPPCTLRAFLFSSHGCAQYARQALLQHAALVAMPASCFYPTLRATCLLQNAYAEREFLEVAERKWIKGIAMRELSEFVLVLPQVEKERVVHLVTETVRRQWDVSTHVVPGNERAHMALKVCLAQMSAAARSVALCLGNEPQTRNTASLLALRSDVSCFVSFVGKLANLLRRAIALETDVQSFAALHGDPQDGKPVLSSQFLAVVSCVMEACTPLILLGQCIVSGVPPSHPPSSTRGPTASSTHADAVRGAMGNMRSAFVVLLGHLAEVDCREMSIKARQLCRMIRFRYRVVCLNCNKYEDVPREMKVCACCKMGTYCCAVCQRNHWESHRHICTFLASLKL